jgi:DnaJ-class molecular chaperone
MEKRPPTPRRNGQGWAPNIVAFKDAQRQEARRRVQPARKPNACIMCDGRGTYTDHTGDADCPECLGTGDKDGFA